MPTPKEITLTKQLLVEGRDAEVFFNALIKQLRIRDIQVQNFGSVNELRAYLKAFILTPGFPTVVTSLGIVRDAESDPKAAFNSVCSSLTYVGLACPKKPETRIKGSPNINVLILPNSDSPGMLETLCLQAVASDPVIPCIDSYFDCVHSALGTIPNNMEKSRVHAFLASRTEPDLLVGQAAHAGYWPWADPVFNHVKTFLQNL